MGTDEEKLVWILWLVPAGPHPAALLQLINKMRQALMIMGIIGIFSSKIKIISQPFDKKSTLTSGDVIFSQSYLEV
jgi:hypothetical protein